MSPSVTLGAAEGEQPFQQQGGKASSCLDNIARQIVDQTCGWQGLAMGRIGTGKDVAERHTQEGK